MSTFTGLKRSDFDPDRYLAETMAPNHGTVITTEGILDGFRNLKARFAAMPESPLQTLMRSPLYISEKPE